MSHEQSVDMQLATIIEHVASTVGAPAAMLENASNELGALYQQAEQAQNVELCTAISVAWTHVQNIAETAKNGEAMTAGLLAVAATIKDQRDAILTEHDALTTALIGLDRSNQLVNDALDEAIQYEMEGIEEYMYDSFVDGISFNGGYIFNVPGEEVQEALLQVPGISELELPTNRQCELLFETIVSADGLTEEEGREFIAFVKDLFGRVEARQDAEHAARNVQHEARMALLNSEDPLLDIIGDDDDDDDEEAF